MQIKIKLENFDYAKQKLEEAATEISDTKPLMAKLSNHLYNIGMDSFDDEKDPYGKPWTPLKESTLKYKSTKKMLYDEGDLQGQFIRRSSKYKATIGTSATFKGFPYPVVMQFGKDD